MRWKYAWVSLGLLLVAVSAFAAGRGRSAEHRVRPFQVRPVGDHQLVVDWDRQEMRRLAQGRGRVRMTGFPLRAGLEVDLDLEPFTVTGPGSRFVLGRKGQPDELLDFDPSSISLFRGTIPGRPGSRVFLALSEHRSTGHIDLGPGGKRYRISSRGGDGEELGPGRTSVFEAGAPLSRPPDVPLCGAEPFTGTLDGAAAPESSHPVKGLKHLELAVETDHEFFSLFDDAAAAMTYLVEMYAQVSDIYIRDVDTRVELAFARLWDNPDDLFNDVDPSPLGEFNDYWEANMGSVQRDVAQLLSGRRDYPFGGQATLSSLCSTSAYSVVGYAMGVFPDPTVPSPYNYDISVTAHELGHNAGTGHTQDNGIDTCHDPLTTPQRGSIMAYCGQTWSGGNSNRDLYFHSIIQSNMDAHINAVSCVVDDCNRNGIEDATDISGATSPDVNINGIPDECEDCNENLVLDTNDIQLLTSADVDVNGVPDECQPDCNGNQIPDSRDIANAISTDAYGNDIPDECETDCDDDGTADFTEIQLDMSLDLDRNARLDACQDCDSDGTNDLDALGAAHRAWVASGLAASPIREFHARTGVLTRTSGGAGLSLVEEGSDLIVAPGGRVLVSSSTDSRVMEFDVDGDYLGDLVSPGSGGLTTPTGMAVTPDGLTLLVASSGTQSVLAYDLGTGASQGAFVASGSGGLDEPFGLVFSPDGNLFVTSHPGAVLEYDGATGAFVRVFVSAAASGGLTEPRGLVFKPDGNLLVASYGTDQVLEYDGATGAAMGRWALSGTATVLTQTSPWGLRIGPNGNVFMVRTGEAFGSGGGGGHDHGHESASVGALHLTNAQLYEFDAHNGNFVRAYINGNDHGMEFPTGFDFVPGWDDDCNLNYLPDSCDITQGISEDLDSSGVPDECETDCNSNGIWDRLDLIPHGTLLDCNNNLTPDACDISAGTSADCTGNGIPDECEADCNGNQIADSCDILLGTADDCDGNGILDDCDVSDDLEIDTGWTAGVAGDTAGTGIWTRVDPIGTSAQPEDDHTAAGITCFVTGQGTAGGGVGENDVDGGITTLLSPSLDLSALGDPEMGYWRWFSNTDGSFPGEDIMTVSISNNGGSTWSLLETVGPTGAEASGGWYLHRFRVSDHVTPSSQVMLRFIASDEDGGSIVEAAIDDLLIFPDCCQSAPAEVLGLLLSQAGPTTLSWTAQEAGSFYDVAGGDLSVLHSSGGTDDALCLADDVAGATWDDLRAGPALAEAYYYLVRSQQSCGAGTYGSASDLTERLPLVDCP